MKKEIKHGVEEWLILIYLFILVANEKIHLISDSAIWPLRVITVIITIVILLLVFILDFLDERYLK